MSRRWGICFCVDNVSRTYPTAIWNGLVEKAEELDVNVYLLKGGSLAPDSETDRLDAGIYNYLRSPRIDGLVVVGAVYVKFRTVDWVTDYFDSFGKPYTSIGIQLGNAPAVTLDNRQGLLEIFDHLIDVHGYRRIAFIRGPENNDEAEVRFECYRQALEKHSIPFDPALTAVGEFSQPTGSEAMREILARAGRPPEAVVAANDYMALGAIEMLQASGLAVPRQCAVAGFDDLEEAAAAASPLTTVAQPLSKQGALALQLLVDQLEGRTAKAENILGTVPVIRNSCGCLASSILELSQSQPDMGVRVSGESVIGLLPPSLQQDGDCARVASAIGELLASENLDSQRETEVLHNLESLLAHELMSGDPFSPWHSFASAITALVEAGGSVESRRAAFLQKLRIVLGEFAVRKQLAVQNRVNAAVALLQNVLLDFVSKFDPKVLYSTIQARLPDLGFPSFYIQEFGPTVDRTSEWPVLPDQATMEVAYCDGRRLGGGEPFPAIELVPETALPVGRRYTFYIQLIHIESRSAGALITEIGPRDTLMHETLRAQIGGALHAADAYQENIRRGEEATRKRDEIEKLVEPILSSLKAVSELVLNRINDMHELSESAHANTKIIEESLRTIEHMNARAREIQELIDGVLDISEQIHLLSINSSIEATRAGTHGRGFSVIAHEISNLADATATTVTDVEQHLKGFISNIDESKQASWNTAESYRTMIGNVEQMTENLHTITSQMEDLSQKSRGILEVMDSDG
jgi:sigma-B regulation protein RsbU (phosphoserine phosphatase)